MYYMAGSPQVYDSSNRRDTPGKVSYTGSANDQKLCSTCVGHAVTKGIPLAVTARLRQNPAQFAVSPQAFYYCAEPAGRSCKTGWDIPDALRAMVNNPHKVLPPRCFNTTALLQGQDEADSGDWAAVCKAAAVLPSCAAITKEQPLYTCPYESLSSLAVNNDFEVQFNASARTRPGLQLPPYRYNVSARPSYAHAALIIGYDNDNYTWTMLNSWGTGRDAGQLRTRGVTADGLLKMQMGLSGVGTPDATYGVSCYPANGTSFNLHHHQPWARSIRRFLTPLDGINGKCYNYTIVRGDTLAAIVDHFGTYTRQVVHDKANRGIVGRLDEFTYAFGAVLTIEELTMAMTTVNSVTGTFAAAASHVQCSQHDADGTRKDVTCALANATACSQPGAYVLRRLSAVAT
uniref:Peptidase C1A papain C-terminal domain-containing protein n=1 Tax=Tetradesmus obliquus TaxID=3088 RepID=A0A383VUU5_TETOB|eukprot:jgi/Sobl393_1/15910/SZX68609.1